MQCTLCGKEAERLNKAEIEGSIVNVCDGCMKFDRNAKKSGEQIYKQIKAEAVEFSKPKTKEEYEK